MVLNESPDGILDLSLHPKDDDAYSFGYYDEKFQISDLLHAGMPAYREPYFDKNRCEGRLWVKRKIIAFWKYPSLQEFRQFIKDVKKYSNITINNSWSVEVCVDDSGKVVNEFKYNYDTHIIPLSSYKGWGKKVDKNNSDIDIMTRHTQSPLLKTKKTVTSKQGKGVRYKQMRYTSESKLRELIRLMIREYVGKFSTDMYGDHDKEITSEIDDLIGDEESDISLKPLVISKRKKPERPSKIFGDKTQFRVQHYGG